MFKTNKKNMITSDSDNSGVSRREMIRTLGLGLSLTALPSFMSSAMTEVSVNSFDEGGRIIPVTEKDLVEMQKFIEDCIAANKESNPQEAVKEVLTKGISDPSAMLKAIGEPTEAGLKVFLRSKDLTNIGIYTGREDNILWERKKNGLEANNAKCLFAGDIAVLNTNAIHSVTNPLQRFTGGLHIYGGDFFATERSQWDPETLKEEPSNGDVIRDIFRKANEQMRRMKND
jgi:hypothetical protein